MSRHETHFVVGNDVHRGFAVAHTPEGKQPIVTAAFGAEFGDSVRIISYDSARLTRLLRQLADAVEAAAVQTQVTGHRVDVELVAEAVPA